MFVDLNAKTRTMDTNEIVSFSCLTYLYLKEERQNRQFRVHPINSERESHGGHHIDLFN